MALGKSRRITPRKYLTISYGKVVSSNGEKKRAHSYVSGVLENIHSRQFILGGNEVVKWYIDMHDRKRSYSICLPYSSGVFKSIVLALMSNESLTSTTPVRIAPYDGVDGYTKVNVYCKGERLQWQAKPTAEDGKEDENKGEFMQLICSYVNVINERLMKQ